jgi:hypothetical protein
LGAVLTRSEPRQDMPLIPVPGPKGFLDAKPER